MFKRYNRNEVIENKQKKLGKLDKEIDKMWQSPWSDVDECTDVGRYASMQRNEINSLKKMNEAENNFNKNINLNEYRNEDGSFNIYKTKRPLNNAFGEESYNKSSKMFHQGIAIGNDKKMLFSDYGVNDGNLNVRFWDSNQPKDHWRDVEFFGKSNASNDQVKDTFFGQNSEKWTNPNDYNLLFHNCQDYSNQIGNNLMKFK